MADTTFGFITKFIEVEVPSKLTFWIECGLEHDWKFGIGNSSSKNVGTVGALLDAAFLVGVIKGQSICIFK